jgi:hypothetical protein
MTFERTKQSDVILADALGWDVNKPTQSDVDLGDVDLRGVEKGLVSDALADDEHSFYLDKPVPPSSIETESNPGLTSTKSDSFTIEGSVDDISDWTATKGIQDTPGTYHYLRTKPYYTFLAPDSIGNSLLLASRYHLGIDPVPDHVQGALDANVDYTHSELDTVRNSDGSIRFLNSDLSGDAPDTFWNLILTVIEQAWSVRDPWKDYPEAYEPHTYSGVTYPLPPGITYPYLLDVSYLKVWMSRSVLDQYGFPAGSFGVEIEESIDAIKGEVTVLADLEDEDSLEFNKGSSSTMSTIDYDSYSGTKKIVEGGVLLPYWDVGDHGVLDISSQHAFLGYSIADPAAPDYIQNYTELYLDFTHAELASAVNEGDITWLGNDGVWMMIAIAIGQASIDNFLSSPYILSFIEDLILHPHPRSLLIADDAHGSSVTKPFGHGVDGFVSVGRTRTDFIRSAQEYFFVEDTTSVGLPIVKSVSKYKPNIMGASDTFTPTIEYKRDVLPSHPLNVVDTPSIDVGIDTGSVIGEGFTSIISRLQSEFHRGPDDHIDQTDQYTIQSDKSIVYGFGEFGSYIRQQNDFNRSHQDSFGSFVSEANPRLIANRGAASSITLVDPIGLRSTRQSVSTISGMESSIFLIHDMQGGSGSPPVDRSLNSSALNSTSLN